nr:PREDICTED: chromatin accessibility complex protein 1 [Phalacrocorax carbo]
MREVLISPTDNSYKLAGVEMMCCCVLIRSVICCAVEGTEEQHKLSYVAEPKPVELFVQYLATYSYKHGRGKEKNALTYSDLSHTAEECETFQFLADILPKKILASKYLKMLEKEKQDGEVGEDDEEDDEEEDEDETVDEDAGS